MITRTLPGAGYALYEANGRKIGAIVTAFDDIADIGRLIGRHPLQRAQPFPHLSPERDKGGGQHDITIYGTYDLRCVRGKVATGGRQVRQGSSDYDPVHEQGV